MTRLANREKERHKLTVAIEIRSNSRTTGQNDDRDVQEGEKVTDEHDGGKDGEDWLTVSRWAEDGGWVGACRVVGEERDSQ